MDRWDALVEAVHSCGLQTEQPFEVIVVIDYNDELLQRSTKEFSAAIVVPNRSTKGLSGARNTGVVTTTGDIVAFLDDDAYAEPNWLEELTKPLHDPNVVGAGGWIVPHWETKPAPWFPETFYWILGCSYSGLPPNGAQIRNPIGANMVMARRVFTSVGGFTSGIGRIGLIPLGCEETELCIRYSEKFANERFVLVRDAVVHHRVPGSRLTWHYFWTRCWAEGLSKAAVASLVGSGSGLAAERQHVMRALPAEFLSALRAIPRAPRVAATKIALIAAGTLFATAGLVRGTVAVRRTPIHAGTADLDSLRGEGNAPTSALPPLSESAG
jgi:hypothetical protein